MVIHWGREEHHLMIDLRQHPSDVAIHLITITSKRYIRVPAAFIRLWSLGALTNDPSFSMFNPEKHLIGALWPKSSNYNCFAAQSASESEKTRSGQIKHVYSPLCCQGRA
jgi:hypothetical protein